MPEKEGDDEKKSTKSVVNKKQKQMMGEEGYDIARDQGRVRPSKDKKDATTLRKPPSAEMKKTQIVNTGPSAFERIKKRYKGQIMKVEELDLTQVAEALGGYIVEQENPPIDITAKNKKKILKQLKQGKPLSGINNKNNKDDLDTSQGVKDELGSNLGNKAKQDAAQDALLDVINDPVKITGDVQKKRAPRKGVDYFADPPEVAKAKREKLAAKRDYYEIDKEGNITDKGVEKYARQMYRTNEPLTQAQLDKAREAAVGGKKIRGKVDKGGGFYSYNVIGTTTGKYGGKLSPQASEKEMKRTQAYLKKRGLTKGFTGDKPQTKDDVKPQKDRVTTGNEIQGPLPAPKPEPKKGVFASINKFTKKNPVTALATYDMGKGILGKIMKARIPNVPTPRAIRVSAKS